jgi:hypothetical protein
MQLGSMERATRRASALSALNNEGILRHVLEYVGAGQHLFVSAVSKDWRACYAKLKLIKMRWKGTDAHWTVSKTQGTLTSAAFSSVSRVKLACDCDLPLRKCGLTRLGYTAGFHSDVVTLAAAHELGLKLSSDVVRGAAAARSVPTFFWLMTEQHCRLPKYITWTAARSGSIEKLAWLKGQGCEWEIDTLRSAIQTSSKQLVEYLIVDGCRINWIACHAAAEVGDLAMLKWLREQGCAWRLERGFANNSLASTAASSGSIELLQWLREQGVEIGTDALISAAAKGRLPLCQHLRAEQVQWSEAVSTAAAAGGHYSTLRWLLDSGCPCDVHRLCCAAAAGCCMDTLTYVVQQHEPGAELLTHMLNAAGSCSELTAAQWLRARGAAWPATLGYLEEVEGGLYEKPWSLPAVEWARHQGCDSPELELQPFEHDDSSDSSDGDSRSDGSNSDSGSGTAGSDEDSDSSSGESSSASRRSSE